MLALYIPGGTTWSKCLSAVGSAPNRAVIMSWLEKRERILGGIGCQGRVCGRSAQDRK